VICVCFDWANFLVYGIYLAFGADLWPFVLFYVGGSLMEWLGIVCLYKLLMNDCELCAYTVQHCMYIWLPTSLPHVFKRGSGYMWNGQGCVGVTGVQMLWEEGGENRQTFNTFNNKINKIKVKPSVPHGRLMATETPHKIK